MEYSLVIGDKRYLVIQAWDDDDDDDDDADADDDDGNDCHAHDCEEDQDA